MAPSAIEVVAKTAVPLLPGKLEAITSHARTYPKNNGSLDKYEHIETTPVIGREYPTVNLVELLQAPNSEELLKELALTSKPLNHQYRRFHDS